MTILSALELLAICCLMSGFVNFGSIPIIIATARGIQGEISLLLMSIFVAIDPQILTWAYQATYPLLTCWCGQVGNIAVGDASSNLVTTLPELQEFLARQSKFYTGRRFSRFVCIGQFWISILSVLDSILVGPLQAMAGIETRCHYWVGQFSWWSRFLWPRFLGVFFKKFLDADSDSHEKTIFKVR